MDFSTILNMTGAATSALAGGIANNIATKQQELANAKNNLANSMVADSNTIRQAAALMSAKYDKGNGMNVSMLNPIQPEVKTSIDPTAVSNAIANAFSNFMPPQDKVEAKPESQADAAPTNATGNKIISEKTAGGNTVTVGEDGGKIKLYPKLNIHNFKYRRN